jgi:hypothetical protein
MVILAVEPTFPVLPLEPLTVDEQLLLAQPSALTAAGERESARRMISTK